MCLPGYFAAEHDVEDDQELAHAGGEGRFKIFFRAPAVGEKVPEDWIGTNRGGNGHIQDAPRRVQRRLPGRRCTRSGARESRSRATVRPVAGARAQMAY